MIRPYTSQDIEELLQLIKLNIPQYFHPDEENDFVKYLEGHADHYYVIEEQGKIIGAGGINYINDSTEARISWDMIHPEFQGKGLGKELTLFRINEIKNQPSVKKIVVRTSQLAWQFYKKCGFELVKVEKDYWAEGFDLYYMSHQLKPA